MDIDKSFSDAGGFGIYQKIIVTSMCFVQIYQAFSYMSIEFLVMSPAKMNCIDKKLTITEMEIVVSKCYKNCESYASLDISASDSLAVQWGLLCSKRQQIAWAQSAYMFTVLIGALIFGPYADHHGRRYTFYLTLAGQIVFSILSAVAPSFLTFVLFRCIQGTFTQGLGLVSFALMIELVEVKYRPICGVLIQVFFALGIIGISGLAYLIRPWRFLALASGLFGIIFIPICIYLVESPRWLASIGRHSDAEKELERISYWNSLSSSSSIRTLESFQYTDSSPPTKTSLNNNFISLLLLNRKTCIWTFCCFSAWVLLSAVYYGLTFAAGQRKGSVYTNFALSGLAELPGYAFLSFLLTKYGRRSCYIVSLLASGIFCLTVGVQDYFPQMPVVLATTLAKLCISMSFAVASVHTAELFPTQVRSAALGMASVASQLGGVIAPAVLSLADGTEHDSDCFVFGCMAVVAGLMVMALPETKPSPGSETIDPGKNFTRGAVII